MSRFKVPSIEFYLDIETTNTVSGAGIWEIGCYIINNKTDVVNSFSMLCRPVGTYSNATLAWIRSKPAVQARYEKALASEITQQQATMELLQYCKSIGMVADREEETGYSWGTFDFPIMDKAFEALGVESPWHYGSTCDLRSVTKFAGSSIRPDTSLHEALEDAKQLYVAHRALLAELSQGG